MSSGGIVISEQEKTAHREAEKALKDQKAKLDQQVKVCTHFSSLNLVLDAMFLFSDGAELTLHRCCLDRCCYLAPVIPGNQRFSR